MTRGDVLLSLADTAPMGWKWGVMEHHADVVAELKRMLSDREMAVLLEVGVLLVLLEYPGW